MREKYSNGDYCFNTVNPRCTTFCIHQKASRIETCKYSVVGCFRLNNTQVCDDNLFGQVILLHKCAPALFRQVSTCTNRHQLPIFGCANVHPWRYTCPQIRHAVLRWRYELQWAHNNGLYHLNTGDHLNTGFLQGQYSDEPGIQLSSNQTVTLCELFCFTSHKYLHIQWPSYIEGLVYVERN